MVHQILDNELILFLSIKSWSETSLRSPLAHQICRFLEGGSHKWPRDAEAGTAKRLTLWHSRRDFTEFETHPIGFVSGLWQSTARVNWPVFRTLHEFYDTRLYGAAFGSRRSSQWISQLSAVRPNRLKIVYLGQAVQTSAFPHENRKRPAIIEWGSKSSGASAAGSGGNAHPGLDEFVDWRMRTIHLNESAFRVSGITSDWRSNSSCRSVADSGRFVGLSFFSFSIKTNDRSQTALGTQM
jgi:hypothetical protein